MAKINTAAGFGDINVPHNELQQGQTIVSLCRDGRTNIHNEELSGQPTVFTDDLLEKGAKKFVKNKQFTVSELLTAISIIHGQ